MARMPAHGGVVSSGPIDELTNRELITEIYVVVDRLRDLLAQVIERRGYGNQL